MAGQWVIEDDEPKGQWVIEDNPKTYGVKSAVRDLTAIPRGIYRGFQDVTDTIVKGGASAVDAFSSNPTARSRVDAAIQANRDKFDADYKDNLVASGGRIAGNIGATWPVGGALGAVASKVPALAPLGAALRSGGFSLGKAGATTVGGKALDIGTRMLGGGATGYASAGLIDPESANTGGIISAVLPVAAQGAGKAAMAIGRGMRRSPAGEKTAVKLANTFGLTPVQLREAVSVKPSPLLPGYTPTVPQILQNRNASALQRTLKTAGTNAIGEAEAVQQAAFMDALNRVAPVDLTLQDAAEKAGDSLTKYGNKAFKKASEKVTREFDAIDPFLESQINIPIDRLKAAQDKFLGAGTFGTGSRAAQAIDTASDVGTYKLPSIKEMTSAASRGRTLEQEVRAAGGIKRGSLGGELSDLGIRQSGTTGLINNKSGQPVDLLASSLHSRGWLPDDDPATLLNMLRNGEGRNVFAADAGDDAMRMAMERSMGDAPVNEIISKPVPWKTVQNLRSSIGEAAEQASAKGANKEAAALKMMVGEIDDKLARLSQGQADAGEFFAPDMVAQYKTALAAHADKMERFKTGPQASMFRMGANGEPLVQGAQVPSKFYSGRRSQVQDVKALKRFIADKPALMADMKAYAVTEGASTADSAGNLTSKYVKWLKSRSGANREMFGKDELATLEEVGKAVQKSLDAESLGRVTGSDTAQKLAALNNFGLLDNKAVDILANRIPIVGNFTGPMLQGWRNTAAQTQNETMAGLLANPNSLAKALEKFGPQDMRLLEYINRMGATGSKAVPALSSQ